MLLFKDVDFKFTHTHHRRKERYSVEPATFTSSFPPGGFSIALRTLDHFRGIFGQNHTLNHLRLPFDLMGSKKKHKI